MPDVITTVVPASIGHGKAGPAARSRCHSGRAAAACRRRSDARGSRHLDHRRRAAAARRRHSRVGHRYQHGEPGAGLGPGAMRCPGGALGSTAPTGPSRSIACAGARSAMSLPLPSCWSGSRSMIRPAISGASWSSARDRWSCSATTSRRLSAGAAACAWLAGRDLWTAQTVLYGTMPACLALAHDLALRPELGLKPVAILTDEEGEASLNAPETADLPVITRGQANIISSGIEVALCASGDLHVEKADWLARLPLRQIFVVHDASTLQVLNPQLRAMGGLLGLELRSAIHMPRNLRLKRILDLVVAIPLALLALPVVAALALAVKAVDNGPAFYAQPRIGRNGHVFKVYKLRSMYADAEARLAAHLETDSAGAPGMGALLQAVQRSADPAEDRAVHPPHQPRRVAAALERPARRDEYRRGRGRSRPITINASTPLSRRCAPASRRA
jgi:hypothetical protein